MRFRRKTMKNTGVSIVKSSYARICNFVEENKTFVMATLMVGMMFLLTMATPSHADTIWNVAESSAKDLITNIKNLYCHAIFPLAFVIDLVLLVLTKDEKKIAVEKRAMITLVVVFIAIYGVYVLRDTVEGLATKVEGSSASG